MYAGLKNTLARHRNPRIDSTIFGPWPSGLATAIQPEQMRPDQLYEALNLIQVGKGYYRTRDGVSLVSSGCSGSVVQAEDIKVNGTWYTIISDTDNKLYYDNSGTATAIATLEGEPRFFGFMGLLIITDGSYIKAWDGSSVFILYDNGSGSSAYQVNKRTDTPTTNKPLGNGTVTAVTYTFTTQAWTSGYTIPPTHLYVTMYKVGTPTGTVTAKVKRTSDDEVMASKAISTSIADFVTDTDGLEYEAIFLSSDVTTELSPNTSYYVSLEYSGGDASNYVNVKAIDASNPQVSLKPGMPPKAVFGIVAKEKIFMIEGTSGTNPGWLWYCARGNHQDWSSADSGGYVGAVDQSATNYPIGGISVWYGDVWIFGTPRQPFLGKLTGSTPSDYTIPNTLQRVSGHYKSTIVTPDDIFFLNPSGVDSVSSIQEYGDIRSMSQTDNIVDQIHTYFSNAAVAGYDPVNGLYCLQMESCDYVYVVHTRAKTVKYKAGRPYSFSPVTRWKFAFSDTVTGFGNGDGCMYIGTSGGDVYKLDKTAIHDDGAALTYKLITSYTNTRFGEANARKLNMMFFAQMGADFNFQFYRNNSRTKFFTLSSSQVTSAAMTKTVDMDILTTSATFSTIPEDTYDRYNINFNFRNLMIGIEDVVLGQEDHVYFGLMIILYTKTGGL